MLGPGSHKEINTWVTISENTVLFCEVQLFEAVLIQNQIKCRLGFKLILTPQFCSLVLFIKAFYMYFLEIQDYSAQ